MQGWTATMRHGTYKKKKHKKMRAHRKSVQKEPIVKRCLFRLKAKNSRLKATFSWVFRYSFLAQTEGERTAFFGRVEEGVRHEKVSPSSKNTYFAQKEPIKVKILETFECSNQNLSNSLCQFLNDKLISF